MEGFEHVVKVALEAERLIVTSNLKFPVRRRTRKSNHEEYQTHGYEVDLVGARRDRLVLASVKSFFGSRGVGLQGFRGLADETKRTFFSRYALFNEDDVRRGVITQASELYGYDESQIELRLYVGRFANDEAKFRVREHLSDITTVGGPVHVFDLDSILDRVFSVINSKTYVNDPVVATLKALKQANRLLTKE